MEQNSKLEGLEVMSLQEWLDELRLMPEQIMDEMQGPGRNTVYRILRGESITKRTAWKTFAKLKAHSPKRLLVEQQVTEFARFGTDKLSLPENQESE
jgi:hypothetical protein